MLKHRKKSAVASNRDPGMRIDKWLWCARFFKTRNAAALALKSGKIKMAGTRIKSSRLVQVGDELDIQLGVLYYNVKITGLAKTRLAAARAALLYSEDEQSRQRREQEAERLKAAYRSTPGPERRPDRRERRRIIRFTRQSG